MVQIPVHAAVALVFNQDLEILAVSRGLDSVELGLPGGKVEPGESAELAMARELEEETGLVPTYVRPCFEGSERGRPVVVYLVSGFAGRLRSSLEGHAVWIPIDDFLERMAFPAFHTDLFEHMGMIA